MTELRAVLGLAFLACFALVRGASAQATQDVGLFLALRAGEDESAMDRTAVLLMRELWQDKLSPRPLSIAPAAAPATSEQLAEVRAIGSAAFGELSEGRSSDEMLATYGERMTRALALAHSVHDGESRDVLWNICLLRVKLFLRSASPSAAENKRAAVSECRRLFLDQRKFSEAWPPAVIDEFKRHDEQQPPVQLELRSAPSGCDIFVNGAAVGTTPRRVSVEPGTQEVQLNCHGKDSRLHRFAANESIESAIWLAGDEALVDTRDAEDRHRDGRLIRLRYADPRAFEQAAEHAVAFAREANFTSFALIQSDQNGKRIDWFRQGAKQSSVHVPLDAADEEVRLQIRAMLHPLPLTANAPAPESRSGLRRQLANYLLAGGLIATGTGLIVFPLRSFARAGKCANEDCSLEYQGQTPLTMGMLGVSTALITAGTMILVWRPFGAAQRAYTVSAGLQSVQLRGAF